MIRIFVSLVSLCVYVSASGAGPLLSSTYESFNPATGDFDLTMSIQFQFPDSKVYGPGPYPVFMWTSGTEQPYNGMLAMLFIQSRAERGFLAATVDYANTQDGLDCTGAQNRAQGVFDANRATSAVSVLCGLPKATCGKGIVTSGFSQGGFLALLARNYAPKVGATYAMGISDYINDLGVSLAACLDKPYTAIPANRLTIVNGASDAHFAGQQPLENVSGFTCPNATQCWSPDNSGAGWYIVQNTEVKDGLADHCYFYFNNGNLCAGLADPAWKSPANFNWSLKPNLDWLSTFGTHRVFSSNP